MTYTGFDGAIPHNALNMLKHRREFALINVRGVGARQTGIERIFDGDFKLRAGRRLSPPVEPA